MYRPRWSTLYTAAIICGEFLWTRLGYASLNNAEKTEENSRKKEQIKSSIFFMDTSKMYFI